MKLKEMKQSNLKGILFVAIAILSAGVFLRVFVIDSYIVRGNSMEPTINEGDYVFVNKLSYAFSKEPQTM